ncbi:MAG: cytochrome c, partial [Caldilineales bacterium]|nr:cytochrome c [Caldilineales bacterium]
MSRQENYNHLLWITLALIVLILAGFQLYINQEPARIQEVQAADQAVALAAGEKLFGENCASCHGMDGQGEDAPALNNAALLKNISDETLFDLTSNGVPGTEMPAWNQARGGPFTDEQIREITAFIRNWEATAPDLGEQRMQVDAKRGARIFIATCAVCHGPDGVGGTAPTL